MTFIKIAYKIGIFFFIGFDRIDSVTYLLVFILPRPPNQAIVTKTKIEEP